MGEDDQATLLAILAAIIYAGADDSEGAAGYTPVSAVTKAETILREARKVVAISRRGVDG